MVALLAHRCAVTGDTTGTSERDTGGSGWKDESTSPPTKRSAPTRRSRAACPGLDHPGQEVRATTFRADVEPLVWEWSDRCGLATNFAYND